MPYNPMHIYNITCLRTLTEPVAMLAIAGMLLQEYTTGNGVLEAWILYCLGYL